MKKILSLTLVCLVCLVPLLGMASNAYFPWLAMGEVTLRVDWADEVDAQAQGWTPDEGYRFVQLHFTIMDGPKPTEDVTANLEVITLRDTDSENYKPAVWQMPGVLFDAETGTFSTEETQTEFDLFYMVPEEMELSALELRAPHEDEGAFFVIKLAEVPAKSEAAE